MIVCEGEKTEPNYFSALAKELPSYLVKVELEGTGANTLDVVKRAIKLKLERKNDPLLPEFDEVWAVFDKDDFPNTRFNEAISFGNNNNIKTAYSNEAFELWYVLHFQFLDAAISRKEYQEILKNKLGKYEKNAVDIYEQLQKLGNEAQAIKWAERLLKIFDQGNPAIEKPTTRVHELVGKLNTFKS